MSINNQQPNDSKSWAFTIYAERDITKGFNALSARCAQFEETTDKYFYKNIRDVFTEAIEALDACLFMKFNSRLAITWQQKELDVEELGCNLHNFYSGYTFDDFRSLGSANKDSELSQIKDLVGSRRTLDYLKSLFDPTTEADLMKDEIAEFFISRQRSITRAFEVYTKTVEDYFTFFAIPGEPWELKKRVKTYEQSILVACLN